VVLAHPFRAMGTFPVRFLSLAVGKIRHLPWVQKVELDLEKIKAIYVPNDDYFVSVGLQ
jgi:hypothetical protein